MRKTKSKIVILGAGAQAKYVLETFSIVGTFAVEAIIEVDEGRGRVGKRIYDIPVQQWQDDLLASLLDKGVRGAIVVHGNNKRKEQVYMKAREMGLSMVNAVHPASVIAKTASMGENIIVNAGAIIQPYARVGNGVMVHAGAIVEHDCVIEDFANLAPGVKLAGEVVVKKRAYIFTGASVIPQRVIGVDSVVGAGAVVINDVPDGVTVVGNPARVLEEVYGER